MLQVDRDKRLKELEKYKRLALKYYNLICSLQDYISTWPSEGRNKNMENVKEQLKEIVDKMLIY